MTLYFKVIYTDKKMIRIRNHYFQQCNFFQYLSDKQREITSYKIIDYFGHAKKKKSIL